MKSLFRKVLRKAGYDFVRFTPRSSHLANLQHCLNFYSIDLVLDVGANTGQYAQLLRTLGYTGQVISFEPLSSAHSCLLVASRQDALWTVAPQVALGHENGEITLNISANSQSSSALALLDMHLKVAPESAYVSSEKVDLKRLDEIAPSYLQGFKDSVFLKIDVQGLEDKVLDGAKNILDTVVGIQLELSMAPLYQGEMPYQDMLAHVKKLGYEIYSLSPVICHPDSGRVLQMDGIFIKNTHSSMSPTSFVHKP